MKKIIILLAAYLFLNNLFSQTSTTAFSSFDTINKYLRIRLVYAPNQLNNGHIRLNLNQIRQGRFPRQWPATGMVRSKKLLNELVANRANGGDSLLQYYVANVLRINKLPVLFYMVSDSIAPVNDAAFSHFGFMRYPNSGSGTLPRVWPAATTFQAIEYFETQYCGSSSSNSRYGGRFAIGEYFLIHDSRPEIEKKGTVIHELVHTQDWSSRNAMHYHTTTGNYRYGIPQTGHRLVEVLPSKEATYKESIANAFMYQYMSAALNTDISTYLGGLDFGIEIPPATLTPATVCGHAVPLSNDIFVYNIITQPPYDITPSSTVTVGTAPNSYQEGVFPSNTLPPRFLFLHNEYCQGLIFAKAMNYIPVERFSQTYEALNWVTNLFRPLQTEQQASTMMNMLVRGLRPRGLSYDDLRRYQDNNLPAPSQCLFPFALLDLMTYSRMNTTADLENIFSDTSTSIFPSAGTITYTRVDRYWLNQYINFKTRNRATMCDSNGKVITDINRLARVFGL